MVLKVNFMKAFIRSVPCPSAGRRRGPAGFNCNELLVVNDPSPDPVLTSLREVTIQAAKLIFIWFTINSSRIESRVPATSGARKFLAQHAFPGWVELKAGSKPFCHPL